MWGVYNAEGGGEHHAEPPGLQEARRRTSGYSRGPFLIRDQDARFRVIRRGHVVKRYVNIFAFRASVFDQDVGNSLGNFALLFRRASLDPRNLHMRHRFPPLNRRAVFYPTRSGSYVRTYPAKGIYLRAVVNEEACVRFEGCGEMALVQTTSRAVSRRMSLLGRLLTRMVSVF